MRLARRDRGETVPALGVWVGSVLLLGAAGSALWLRLGLALPGCAFRDWTGLPCASCGGTRMFRALLSGQPLEALAWNPLAFVVLTSMALWSLVSAARLVFDLPGWRLVTERRERRLLIVLAVGAALAGWLYLVLTGV